MQSTNNRTNQKTKYFPTIIRTDICYATQTKPKPKPKPTEESALMAEIMKGKGGLIDSVKKGSNALVAWVNENSIIINHVLEDSTSLAMKVDGKGNTVGHVLARMSEEYALTILNNPKHAAISNDNGDSICIDAIRMYNSAATKASKNIELWKIENPNTGDTVGHEVAKHHEPIIIELLKGKDAETFLSIENDARVTVASVGTIHKNFSLLVLNYPNIYSLPLCVDTQSVAQDAVNNHYSSAIRAGEMLRDHKICLDEKRQDLLVAAVRNKIKTHLNERARAKHQVNDI